MHSLPSIGNFLPAFKQHSSVDNSFLKAFNQGAGKNSPTESLSFSHSSSVNVSISTQGMQLSYQSQTSFSFSSGVEAVSRPSPAESMHTPELSADNILKFVEQHVQNLAGEGASSEELESALNAGLSGFETGRDEAIDILKGYGLYEGPIAEGVAKTTSLVEAGIESLRERFVGGDTGEAGDVDEVVTAASNVEVEKAVAAEEPAVQAPVEAVVPALASPITTAPSDDVKEDKQSHEVSNRHHHSDRADRGVVASYRERFSSSESVDLTVQTLDGDIITLNLEAFQEFQRQYELDSRYGAGGRGNGFSVSSLNESSSYDANFAYSVEGELDEGEIAALQDLFSQVNELATNFFSGDLAAALEQAQSLNMDVGELASMSLNMTQTITVQAESTYRNVSDMGEGRDHGRGHQGLQGLGQHTKGLMEMLNSAQAFAQPNELISDLFAAAFAKLDTESEVEDKGEALQEANNRLIDAVAEQYALNPNEG